MKIICFVQSWNKNDPIRGFTIDWIEELSTHYEKVFVIALEKKSDCELKNVEVFSLGKEDYESKWYRHFYYLRRINEFFLRILSIHSVDVIFTHMTPIYSIISFPYAKIFKVPIVTWYAHKKVHLIVKLAHHLSNKVFTINSDSYKYCKDSRLVYLGHGVKQINFQLNKSTKEIYSSDVLFIGRVAKIKNLELLVHSIRNLARNKNDLKVKIVGPIDDKPYYNKLLKMIREMQLENTITFFGPIPNHQIWKLIQSTKIHVNLSPTGALDKSVIECAMLGVPSVVVNDSYKNLFKSDSSYFLSKPEPLEISSKLENFLFSGPEFNKSISSICKKNSEQYSLKRFIVNLIKHMP